MRSLMPGTRRLLPASYPEMSGILVRSVTAALLLLAAAAIVRDLAIETRAEALARCERRAEAHRDVQYVAVEKSLTGWSCLFGSGSP